MKKKLISFLSVVLIVTVFTGCKNNNSSTTPTPSAQINSNKEYKQSPILTEKSGLPELKDRLPKDPKIENEMPDTIMKSEIGTYGGTLRTSTSVISYDADVFVANNEALLNTPGLVGDVIVPNIVKKYDMNVLDK